MDSVTQILLGAAVGEATLGHRVGRKAAAWGAVCGTLPDLDVLVPFSDPVAAFTYHRSFSHSLIMLALLTPLMVWLIRKIHPSDDHHRLGWYLLVYLAFATHALLDASTIYGTQLLWPVVTTPATWGSIFIIDPLFTAPLICGLFGVALLRGRPLAAYKVNAVALSISAVYLAWAYAAKFHVQGLAAEALARQEIGYERMVTLAGPFNTLLWRIVAMDEESYVVGWYSLFDADRDIRFERFASAPELLDGIRDEWPVRRLQWFTKGFYKVGSEDGDIVITDLRMGVEDYYVFSFRVGRLGNPHASPAPTELRSARPELSALPDLWRRLKGNREIRLN